MENAKYTHYYDSPIGTLKIVANEAGILSVLPSPMPASYDTPHTPHIADTVQWLNTYFKDKYIGQIPSISAKITPWQWDLTTIPPGQTRQYGNIKTKNHARAYGRACSTNPIYIIIPCHRVVSASGVIKYGGGAEMKVWLLNHEKNFM